MKVEEAKVESQEGGHGKQEETASIKGEAALSPPDISRPEGDHVTHDGGDIVDHLVGDRQLQ